MSAQRCFYGSGFSDFPIVFPEEELEQLLFGYRSSSSPTVSLLDWAMTSASAPPSPPALANLSQSSYDLMDTELVPDVAQTFYACIEGQYDPCLFVDDPFSFFVNEKDSPSIKPKRCRQKQRTHSHFLRPHGCNGFVVKPYGPLQVSHISSSSFPYPKADCFFILYIL
ncbi:hypothetical protein O181_061522 [Austropuccinia psidii MF-1]|uniref:Uncharacterized protein n=1 Tax=Austropuccinia psidii MF-1 TaxID=1389203 RepID=A0A9Q3EQL0_9BASI|nr:hypothetical protein [Austropuccinia psidii MF-1]